MDIRLIAASKKAAPWSLNGCRWPTSSSVTSPCIRARSSMNSAAAPSGRAISPQSVSARPGAAGTAASCAGVQPSNTTSAKLCPSRHAACPTSLSGSGVNPGTGVP